MKTIVGTNILEAASFLNSGKVVAVPTETVYGMAACIRFNTAIDTVYKVKGRPSNDPLIVHISDYDQLNSLVSSIPAFAQLAMDAFWPGPLTLLFEKSALVSDEITSGSPLVAIRMPSHPDLLEIIKQSGPLAAPSANPFGYVSPTTAQHVYHHFQGKIPYIFDGGSCRVGLESTILRPMPDGFLLLREGAISRERLINHIQGCKLHIPESTQNALPGGMEKHYSPSKSLVLSPSPLDELAGNEGKKIALLLWNQNQKAVSSNVRIINYSVRGSIDDAAENLFALLRELDESDCEIIVAEKVPDEGIGRAINDRLRRASVKVFNRNGLL